MNLRGRTRDEAGASLILALIFIVVTSVIMLSLTSLATNGLSSLTQFRTPQLERSALDSAMTTAIYQERYTVTPSSLGNNTVVCAPSVTIPEPNQSGTNDTFQIWCSTSLNLASDQTRTVTFSACLGTNGSTICATPLLVATVVYDDYTYPVSQILTSYCTVNCGTAETINSWVLESTQ